MKILYIEGCNYVDYPVGGQLTFAKQFLNVIDAESIALVGIVTEKFPIGSWQKRTINGKEYDFFALFNANKSAKKPFIPLRLQIYFSLRRYKKRVLEFAPDLTLTRSPEVVVPISKWGYKKLCYYFAGTGNPLAISRRWYGRKLAPFYDRFFFPPLAHVNVILAAADKENIADTVKRSAQVLKDGDIIPFPTRINTNIFKPQDKEVQRQALSVPQEATVITTTGRLHWAKGWPLMLDAFRLFLKSHPNSLFYFLGDGNEREAIEGYIAEHQLGDKVFLLGFQDHQTIASYISASDMFVMGSLMEGWATSLVEAKACGVPICTSSFSSATSIVNEGQDGFVLKDRDPETFALKMEAVLDLRIDKVRLAEEMKQYSLECLKENFMAVCK